MTDPGADAHYPDAQARRAIRKPRHDHSGRSGCGHGQDHESRRPHGRARRHGNRDRRKHFGGDLHNPRGGAALAEIPERAREAPRDRGAPRPAPAPRGGPPVPRVELRGDDPRFLRAPPAGAPGRGRRRSRLPRDGRAGGQRRAGCRLGAAHPVPLRRRRPDHSPPVRARRPHRGPARSVRRDLRELGRPTHDRPGTPEPDFAAARRRVEAFLEQAAASVPDAAGPDGWTGFESAVRRARVSPPFSTPRAPPRSSRSSRPSAAARRGRRRRGRSRERSSPSRTTSSNPR